MSKVIITLNGIETNVEAGFTQAVSFYEQLGTEADKKWLYLGREDDIDIPLLPDDYLVIHGGEKIFEGKINSDIGDNPSVRRSIYPEFNGKKLEAGFDKAKVAGRSLREMDKNQPDNKLFADLRGQVDAFIKDDLTVVVQDSDSYFTIPGGDDDAIDLEICARADRKPPKGQKHYKIKIDGEKYKISSQKITGTKILSQVGKNYDAWTLNQKLRGGRRKLIEADEAVDLAQPGIERFETVRRQAQQGGRGSQCPI